MVGRFITLVFSWKRFLKNKKARALLLLVALLLFVWGGIAGFAWWNYKAAQQALDKDDLDGARTSISRTLKVWPHSADSHFLAARIQRLRDSFKEAETHLRACQNLEGRTERLQLEWLLLRLQAGESTEVAPGLRNCVLEDHPQSGWILEALARSYFRDLRFRQAYRCLEFWLKKEPGQLRALMLRARLGKQMDVEFREQTLADYQHVLELNPDNWRARLDLADVFLSDRKTIAALNHLEIVGKAQGECADYLLVLGKARVLEGKTGEARELFNRVVALNSKNPQVFQQLGQIELQEGRPVEAERCFRNALKVDPTFGVAYFSLYSALIQQNQTEKAQIELQNYKDYKTEMENVKKHLDDFEKTGKPNSLVEAGELIARRGNEELGRQFLLRALEMDPANRKAHQLLMDYYTRKNQPHEAAKHRKYLH
jgi:tetratricopeptide (TPR) repeat protein